MTRAGFPMLREVGAGRGVDALHVAVEAATVLVR